MLYFLTISSINEYENERVGIDLYDLDLLQD